MNTNVIILFSCVLIDSDALAVLDKTYGISNIYFYLSNRETQTKEVEFRLDDINTSLITKKIVNIVIVHGWTETHLRPHYLQIRDEYLKKYDCNIYSFDYNRLDQKGYSYVTEIAPDLGELIAEALITLKNAEILNFNQVHVVGHSLGCHVAGFIGQNIFKLTNEKLAKITALDPAGPMYNGAPLDKKLSGSDALSVVVLHTDGLLFGANENMGSLDIYFNPFRPLQPGCSVGDFIKDGDYAYCNHWISYKYFIVTINKPQYTAIECSSAFFYVLGLCAGNRQVLYREDIEQEVTGTYYVSADSPLNAVISYNQ